jgi:hypothetical protein
VLVCILDYLVQPGTYSFEEFTSSTRFFWDPQASTKLLKKISGWVGKRKTKLSTEIGAASHDQA